MKTIALLLSTALTISTALAQKEKTETIKAPINHVTVYLDGAEVSQSKQVSLAAGRNNLLFIGLSPNIMEKSIRVSTSEEISILSISMQNNYTTKAEDKPRIAQLKDSIDLIDKKINALMDDSAAYQTQKRLLLKNQSLGGLNTGVQINDLKAAADFYLVRMKEIGSKITSIEYYLRGNIEVKNRLTLQLNSLASTSGYSRNEISVLVSAKSPTATTIELKYLVAGAGWAPSYDIKATEVSKPIELIYRAKVFNNTGIDWENVSLKLSTADPNKSATKPELKPWYLSFVNNYQDNAKPRYYKRALSEQQNMSQNLQSYDKEEKSKDFMLSSNELVYQEVDVNETYSEFNIEQPYSIPSDNQPYLIDVTKNTLPAAFKHVALPKQDKDAFLLAQITGWEDLSLVEGPASIYLSGTYVGESYIKTRSVRDTLDLSLGRDSKVLVTRTKQKNFSSTKFIGSKRKETISYEIIVKNNRKNAISIDLIDQLPVSQNSEIEVKKLELSNGDLNAVTGEVKWRLNLEPSQMQKVIISFEVEYPKGHEIQMEKNEKRYMRKF